LRGGSLTALAAALLLQACAQLPDLAEAPQPKSTDAFQSGKSLQAAVADWPVDKWWTTYGDAQLNTLVDEALADSPDLAAATARLQRAQAMTQVSGSVLKPQVSANAAFSEDKLSYNHLLSPVTMPHGGNDYGRVSLDFRWELDFWGKNRAALAAATSELDASQAELAQARLILASGVAASYAELSRLYANRDTAAQSVDIRQKRPSCLPDVMPTAWKRVAACVRPMPVGRWRKGLCWRWRSKLRCSAITWLHCWGRGRTVVC
jgi:outer membrane protein TolC